MWSCLDGSEKTVTYDSGTSSALTTYLTHSDDEDIQTLTLNDYTYVVNRTKTVAMDSATAPARPFEGGALLTEEEFKDRIKRDNKPVGNQMKTLLGTQ